MIFAISGTHSSGHSLCLVIISNFNFKPTTLQPISSFFRSFSTVPKLQQFFNLMRNTFHALSHLFTVPRCSQFSTFPSQSLTSYHVWNWNASFASTFNHPLPISPHHTCLTKSQAWVIGLPTQYLHMSNQIWLEKNVWSYWLYFMTLFHDMTLTCYHYCYDCSPPGSSVHGILQARILDW